MRFNDAILGLVLIGFALLAGAATRNFPSIPGQAYGAAMFPRILCVAFAICGVVLIASGIRNRATQPLLDRDPWARSPASLATLALVLAGIVFYVLVSETLGFIPTAFLMMFAILIRLRGHWRSSLVIAVAATMVVHYLFYSLLLVPLPWGVLEPLVF
ncbi:MAG TPA: tripartite tricarboxylate transporter TctB family protein [Thalassobaculum sp.]